MPLLETRAVGYRIGPTTLFEGVDLRVRVGERVAVVGPSGSGKSSLLSLLAGLASPTSGEVLLDGQPLDGPAGPGRGVAMVLQGYGLVSLLTAAENVEVALRAGVGCGRRHAAAAARAVLEDLGLGEHADQLAEELSGGQQQRVAVARALALRPRLLIADEPTAELDPVARALVLARLVEPSQERTLVMATHDMEVAAWCDRTLDLGAAGTPRLLSN